VSESSERSRRWSRAEAWLIATSLSMGALAAVFVTALALDPRVLPSGAPVRWKPLRFASAFAVHAVTLCWLARATDRPEVDDRWFRWAAFLQIGAMFFELVLIALQALRGVPSHFNVATPFDGAVFSLVGIGTGGLFAGWGGARNMLGTWPDVWFQRVPDERPQCSGVIPH
jgi:hypothetical protein